MEPPTPSGLTRHLVLVLDRSGSMATVADDTTGGVASLLADQRAAQDDPGNPVSRTLVTLAQFDSEYELLYDREPIENGVKWVCHPRGMTALHDAVGRTIATVRQAAADEGQTVLVIVTDGRENSSTEYEQAEVRKLIEQAQADDWEILFLGAGLDAWSISDGLGVPRSHSSSYTKSAEGTRAAYAATSGMVVNSSGGRSRGFSDADRERMTRTDQPETD